MEDEKKASPEEVSKFMRNYINTALPITTKDTVDQKCFVILTQKRQRRALGI